MRRTASPSLIGTAAVLVGLACLLLGSGGLSSGTDYWLICLLSLLVGSTMVALAGSAPRTGLYGGVIARSFPAPGVRWGVRALVLLTAPLAGIGVLAYAAASLAHTLRGVDPVPAIDWRQAAGTGMLSLALVIVAVGGHAELAPPIYLWSALLVGAGLAQFWSAAGNRPSLSAYDLFDHATVRTGLGALLASAGTILFVGHILRLRDAGHIATATALAVAVLAGIGGPWWFRSRRMLERERLERALAVERAEIADQLHDSVLQTLALIQRRSADPETVERLARQQERELRDWLLGRTGGGDATSLAAALRSLVADIEDAHSTRVEVVTVGDAPLEPPTEAILAAAREALINTARHAPGAPVSVFMRADGPTVQIFVHDRGPGFDPARIDPDRHGITDSIVARMTRHGGTAEINSRSGAGCEITLTVRRR